MAEGIVEPNINPETVGETTTKVVVATSPFIPQKVRASIYAVAGLVGAVSAALVPVLGGLVGDVLSVVAAAATATVSALAVSHIGAQPE